MDKLEVQVQYINKIIIKSIRHILTIFKYSINSNIKLNQPGKHMI